MVPHDSLMILSWFPSQFFHSSFTILFMILVTVLYDSLMILSWFSHCSFMVPYNSLMILSLFLTILSQFFHCSFMVPYDSLMILSPFFQIAFYSVSNNLHLCKKILTYQQSNVLYLKQCWIRNASLTLQDQII